MDTGDSFPVVIVARA